MRVCGTISLQDIIKWSPSQLLAMIKEIDKILPEEGMIETSTAGTSQSTQANQPLA
jgi:hypothetical protein